MILVFAFQNMKLDDRKWYINIALFVFLFLLLNALAYSFEAAHGGEIYLQMPSVPIGVWWCVVGVIDALLIWEATSAEKDENRNYQAKFYQRGDECTADRNLLFYG